MRRILAAAALTALVALGAGCTSTGSPSPGSTTAARPSATPSVDASGQAICDDLQKTILDTDVTAFGAELGKMMAARLQGDKAGESTAQTAAVAKLTEIVGKLRRHAGTATDPKLKSALNESADNVEKLAADTSNFSNIKSLDQVSETTQKFATSLDAIAQYCA